MNNIKHRKRIKAVSLIMTAALIVAAATCAAFASDGLTSSGLGSPGPGGFPGGMGGRGQSGTANYASEPTAVITSDLTENSAEALAADTANAETIVMSADNNNVKISKSGTYIVTGTCADGNLAVKKGTTGVVLILKDLDLTSTTGATVSLNKGTEVKVIIEGTVKLTDAEDIADEESDDFDGAALKAKVGSSVVLTGTGTLNINGSCKHGIKVSGLDAEDVADGYTEASFIIDGKDLTINITAEDDGLNSGNDLTIKSGKITVTAGDDGIKADYILTIGEEGSDGPTINVTANETIEGATINIYSGNIDVNAEDDGINAANKDLEDYTYSCNIMGGTINITAGADGIDSNGNINILGGLTTIVKSASNGGEGGIDYEGSCYVKEGCLVNPYGTTMDSGMGSFGGQGGPGGNGGFPGWNGQNGGQTPPGWNGADGESGATPELPDGQTPPDWGGENDQGGFPGWNGQNGERPARPGQQGDDPSGSSENVPEDSGSGGIGGWFADLWNTIRNWFAGIFSK